MLTMEKKKTLSRTWWGQHMWLGRWKLYLAQKKFDLRFSPASSEYTNCRTALLTFAEIWTINGLWFTYCFVYRPGRRNCSSRLLMTMDNSYFLAAHALPDWAEPDTCENRLVLTRGKFYLFAGWRASRQPVLSKCCKKAYVYDTMQTLDCISEIDAVIQARLSQVKKMPILQKHHTICYMPVAASKFLETHKEIIPLAIDAYYHRNETILNYARTRNFFFSEANNPSAQIVN